MSTRPARSDRTRSAPAPRRWVAWVAAWLCLLAAGANQLAPLVYAAMVERAAAGDQTFICHSAPPGTDSTAPRSGDSQTPQHCPLCGLLANQTVAPSFLAGPDVPVPAMVGTADTPAPRSAPLVRNAALVPLTPRGPPATV
ncbi:MAG: DUF2946 family protein [Magnetospirillum sp.]|nr:DUF2946 family protein [Magnetospirillum sp.]